MFCAISLAVILFSAIIVEVTALVAGKVSCGRLPIYDIYYPYVCCNTETIVSTELAVSETTFIISLASSTSF